MAYVFTPLSCIEIEVETGNCGQLCRDIFGTFLSSFRAILFPVANGNGPYPFSVDVPRYTRSLFSNEVLSPAKAVAMKYSHQLKPLQNQL